VTTFHYVAIVYDRGRCYYSRRASFSAPSLKDAAQIVLTGFHNRIHAYVLRDGATGRRYSLGELQGQFPEVPWHATWWRQDEWQNFFAARAQVTP